MALSCFCRVLDRCLVQPQPSHSGRISSALAIATAAIVFAAAAHWATPSTICYSENRWGRTGRWVTRPFGDRRCFIALPSDPPVRPTRDARRFNRKQGRLMEANCADTFNRSFVIDDEAQVIFLFVDGWRPSLSRQTLLTAAGVITAAVITPYRYTPLIGRPTDRRGSEGTLVRGPQSEALSQGPSIGAMSIGRRAMTDSRPCPWCVVGRESLLEIVTLILLSPAFIER